MKKRTLFSFFLFVFLTLLLILLYRTPLKPHLTKNFWELVSEFSLLFAMLFAWIRYGRSHHIFFSWLGLLFAALYLRDLHLIIFKIPVFSSLPYYLLIFGAFFWGWKKRDALFAFLKENPRIIVLWGAVFLFYLTGYLCDHGTLHNIAPVERAVIKPFENYLEEASEAFGSFLLLVSVMIARKPKGHS